MAITSQFNLKQGLRIVDDSMFPVSAGKVSDTGMHVPDLDIIDGKNIIPTISGYTSFFGADRNVDNTVLGSLKVQEIITYRTKHGDNIYIAFTNAGLYISSAAGSGTATRSYANPNLADTTDDLTGGPETIDLAGATGNFTLSVYGTAAVTVAAGTATGTGFGQATEGNDVTFNITVSGTITLTLDSGTLDLELGEYMKKVEEAASSTFFIPFGDPARIAIDFPSGVGDWIWVFGSTLGHASPWELWTYVLIENDLYIYYKGLRHIYRMYSVEPEQVLFDELLPSYIISNDKLWQFTINAEDDSAGDDTYKAVAINTDSGIFLGNYVHSVDKAHEVWNIEDTVLAPFHYGLPAHLENIVKAKVDIDVLLKLNYLYIDPLVSANGEASELIITWGEHTPAASVGRNIFYNIVLTDIQLDGIITMTFGDPVIGSVDVDLTTATTKADVVSAITLALDDFLLDPDTDHIYPAVMYYEDRATNKDEISLYFRIVTAIPGSSGSNAGISYTGTGTVAVESGEGSSDWYTYTGYVKPKYMIDVLDGYTTFSAGEEATVTVDGVDYTVVATASESSSSIITRLGTLLLENTNFQELIKDTPDGSFSFTKTDPNTWDLGGSRTVPITTSNNIKLDNNQWAYDTSYNPDWTMTVIAAVYSSLRIQGFKEYGLTQLSFTLDGVVYSIPVFPSDDSNDIADKIEDLLDILNGGVASRTNTALASATADYNLIINVPIFDNSTPSPTLDQDGTTLWAVNGGATTWEIIELLQVDGIFYARGRLGYWTKDNVLGWSAHNNPIDFIPSTVTRANQISVKALQGDIIKCIGYQSGFIIYATGNIIRGNYIKDSINVFTFDVTPNAPGIADPRHVTANMDMQFYWHDSGLYAINPYNNTAEEQIADLGDWINKFKYPVTLNLLGNRYLVINLLYYNIDFSNRSLRNSALTTLSAIDANTGSPVGFDPVRAGKRLYPVYTRHLLYDIKLKRWGTCDQDTLLLSSLVPWNQQGYQLDRDYDNISEFLDNQQRSLLILKEDGKLWVANDNPDDSYILFGHYAAHRTKRTKVSEIYLEFVKWPEATVELEKSLDWSTILWNSIYSKTISSLRNAISPNLSAYWFNVLVRGRFHLKRGMIKGYKYGR